MQSWRQAQRALSWAPYLRRRRSQVAPGKSPGPTVSRAGQETILPPLRAGLPVPAQAVFPAPRGFVPVDPAMSRATVLGLVPQGRTLCCFVPALLSWCHPRQALAHIVPGTQSEDEDEKGKNDDDPEHPHSHKLGRHREARHRAFQNWHNQHRQRQKQPDGEISDRLCRGLENLQCLTRDEEITDAHIHRSNKRTSRASCLLNPCTSRASCLLNPCTSRASCLLNPCTSRASCLLNPCTSRASCCLNPCPRCLPGPRRR